MAIYEKNRFLDQVHSHYHHGDMTFLSSHGHQLRSKTNYELFLRRLLLACAFLKVRTMSTNKWAASKSTQLSTKVWVKLLLLLENALKLSFEAL